MPFYLFSLEACVSGIAPSGGAAWKCSRLCLTAKRFSLEKLPLLIDQTGSQRQVIAFATDCLLAFAAEDKGEELAHLGFDWLPWRAVNVNGNVPEQRVIS